MWYVAIKGKPRSEAGLFRRDDPAFGDTDPLRNASYWQAKFAGAGALAFCREFWGIRDGAD